jgi:FkbM family methyltransferase
MIRPYLAWRPLTLSATTSFGGQFEITLPDSIQTYIYFFGVWEPTITEYVQNTLEAGDIFIDIGANIGYHSLLASKCVGSTGHVYCFEASPSIYTVLERNLARNGARNVTSFNVAVVNEPGEVTVYLNVPENLGGSTVVPEAANERSAKLEAVVPGLPLPKILDASIIRRARLIKVDVEGAEWDVVKGIGSALISEFSKNTSIIMEIDRIAVEARGGRVEQLLSIFVEQGYSAFQIENQYEVEFYAKRPKLILKPIDRVVENRVDVVFQREPV